MAAFEGTIPEGEYGAGTIAIWDKGTYSNIKQKKDGSTMSMKECLTKGSIKVELHGKLLRGPYALVRMKNLPRQHWLLIKIAKKVS